MRIAIMGASGRVGTRLVEIILASPGLKLAAALVSPKSARIGMPVAGSSTEYRPADAAMRSHCDVVIDFSTPAASIELQQDIGGKVIPVVIGTTGFSPEENLQLTEFSVHRPLLMSPNFAHGFEAFRRSTVDFALSVPSADVTVSETYHDRKKADPSGTSNLVAAQLFEARSRAMGFAASEPIIEIHRRGNAIGVNEVRFNMGATEAVFTYRVHTLGAYAVGALTAAQWLVSRQRPAGIYSLADCRNFNDREELDND